MDKLDPQKIHVPSKRHSMTVQEVRDAKLSTRLLPVLEVPGVHSIVMSSRWAHKQMHFGWALGLCCGAFRCCSRHFFLPVALEHTWLDLGPHSDPSSKCGSACSILNTCC